MLLADVGRSTSLVSAAGELPQVHWRWWSGSMPGKGNSSATVGSLAAGQGQFRGQSWSIAVANVGRWLAFCRKSSEAGTCQQRAVELARKPGMMKFVKEFLPTTYFKLFSPSNPLSSMFFRHCRTLESCKASHMA